MTQSTRFRIKRLPAAGLGLALAMAVGATGCGGSTTSSRGATSSPASSPAVASASPVSAAPPTTIATPTTLSPSDLTDQAAAAITSPAEAAREAAATAGLKDAQVRVQRVSGDVAATGSDLSSANQEIANGG